MIIVVVSNCPGDVEGIEKQRCLFQEFLGTRNEREEKILQSAVFLFPKFDNEQGRGDTVRDA